MKKKILYILPDYNYATLNAIHLLAPIFDIQIVAPYNIKLLKIFPFKFIPSARRRVDDWNKISSKVQKNIITNNIFRLIFLFIEYYRIQKKLIISNILKRNLEHFIIDKINFKEYDILYSFDGCSLVYQKKAKENGLITLMESRGNHIDLIIDLHKKINKKYNTNLPEKDDPGENWFNKLRNEINYADGIIAYSDFHKKQFESRLIYKHQKVFKIPISSKFTFAKAPKQYNQLKFVSISNQSAAKGIPQLRAVWNKIYNKIPKEVSLVFIGNIVPEDPYEETKRRIEYKGFIQPMELEEYLKETDCIMVLPTFYDSFGMVVIEALSKCIPVITNSNCGASELINKDQFGAIYEDPFDFNALEKLMLMVANDRDIAQKWSANISNSFNPSIIEKQRIREIEKMGKWLNELKDYSHL